MPRNRRPRSIPTAPFTPLTLGPVLWLRADLGITTVSGKVSIWNDQSSRGNNATQGTVASRPTYNSTDASYNNQATVQFSGGTFMSLAALLPNQPFTALFVGESTSGAGNEPVFGDTGTGVGIWWFGTDWGLYAGTTLLSSNTSRTINAFAGICNTTTSTLYINSSASAAASGTIGSGNPSGTGEVGAALANTLTGKVAELVVYSGVLSIGNISSVFKYFGARYNQSWK